MFTPPKKGERRGGRKKGSVNKSTSEIRELAQAHGPAAIAAAVRLMKNAESETARIAAITLILDRGYGKPTQPLSGAVGSYDATKLAGFSLEELKAFEALLTRIDSGPTAAIGYSSGDSEA